LPIHQPQHIYLVESECAYNPTKVAHQQAGQHHYIHPYTVHSSLSPLSAFLLVAFGQNYHVC
jgi:hypothetical protein